MGDDTHMPQTTVAGYEEVLTHVGGVSLFLGHSVQPAQVVFCELNSMELEGEVLPTAGGLSLLLEEEEDCNCEGTLVEQVSDDVLTHVGGSSLLEFVRDTTYQVGDAKLPEDELWSDAMFTHFADLHTQCHN